MKKPQLSPKHGIIFLAALIVSLLASTQLKAVSTLFFAAENRDTGAVNPMREIKLLVDSNTRVSQEIDQKEKELVALRDENSRSTELEHQRDQGARGAGELPIQGAGIRLSIDTTISSSALIDLLNSLWAHGASALSVNGVRLTELTSGIDRVDTRILVNGKEITAPYEILVLGNTKLLNELNAVDGEISHLQKLFPQAKITQNQEEMTIPAL